MGKLEISDMVFYSKHGCFEEEQIVGNKFIVNFEGETDMALPCESDSLSDAVNYQEVYDVIKEEMAKTSKLLENVAGRILKRIQKEFPALTSATISVSKINPPLGGQTGAFKVTMSYGK